MSNIVKIDTELTAIEPSKAAQIKATFEPMIQMLESFESQCGEIFALAETGITPEISARAKRTRLDIAKVRTSADKARKEMKEEYLRAGNAIQGAYNVLAWAVSDRENRLKEIEDHAERMEAIRLQELQVERANLLRPYSADADERNLSALDADTFEALLDKKRREHEERVEAERLAELERERLAKIAQLHTERQNELISAGLIQFTPVREFGEIEATEWRKLVMSAKAQKSNYEIEQARIRKENERLQAERIAAEEAAKIEREKAEQERRAMAEKAAKAEAEARRLQAEAKAREDAERRAEAERIAAEKKAKAAPDKDKIIAAVRSLAYSVDVKTEQAAAVNAEISAKFEAFKTWAIKQTEAL